MIREKNSDNGWGKNEKQPEDCPSDYQRPSRSEQKSTQLHSIFENIVDDSMLHYNPKSNYFEKRNNYFMQKTVELLPRVTHEDLHDFHEFSRFVKTFLVRAQYHCNSMLYHFLSGAVESMDPETDPVSHADFLVETLFKEIQSMNDAVAVSATIKNANKEYECWLADKVLEENFL